MRTLIFGGLLRFGDACSRTCPNFCSARFASACCPSLLLRKRMARGGDESKLIGLNVYNDQDEKLGAISEIVLDKSGRADCVVIDIEQVSSA